MRTRVSTQKKINTRHRAFCRCPLSCGRGRRRPSKTGPRIRNCTL